MEEANSKKLLQTHGLTRSVLILKDLVKLMAERVGFEPTVLVKVHTLSKRAP